MNIDFVADTGKMTQSRADAMGLMTRAVALFDLTPGSKVPAVLRVVVKSPYIDRLGDYPIDVPQIMLERMTDVANWETVLDYHCRQTGADFYLRQTYIHGPDSWVEDNQYKFRESTMVRGSIYFKKGKNREEV